MKYILDKGLEDIVLEDNLPHTIQEKPNLECELCKYEAVIKNHVKTHDSSQFACTQCSHTSRSEFVFELHMQNDHGENVKTTHPTCFPCEDCGMIFAT